MIKSLCKFYFYLFVLIPFLQAIENPTKNYAETRKILLKISKYNSKLLEACRQGDLPKVNRLLKLGINPNSRNLKNKEFALGIAAQNGHTDICSLLLDYEADIHYIDKYGNNALILATSGGNLNTCIFLVKKGADIHAKIKSGMDAFLNSIYYRHPNICEFLLKSGANYDVTDKFKSNFLTFMSPITGHAIDPLIKEKFHLIFRDHFYKLISQDPEKINKKDGLGLTLLQLSKELNDLEFSQDLLVKGAAIDAHYCEAIGCFLILEVAIFLKNANDLSISESEKKFIDLYIKHGTMINFSSPQSFILLRYYPEIIEKIIIRPYLETTRNKQFFDAQKKILWHTLACLQKMNLSKDIKKLIISYLNFNELNEIMIERKRNGLNISSLFYSGIINYLYNATKNHINNSVIMHNESPEIPKSMLKNMDNIFEKYSQGMIINIQERISQKFLKLNSP